jgi:pectate lyase
MGGRGGKVFKVTNLNDSGDGSLRSAVEAEGPRTVVFAVSGTIQLKTPLIIRNPHITIAGQTAPGGGITLRDYTLHIDAQEVVVRYIRSRLGNVSKVEDDSINIRDGARNVILDHVSVSWSTDEALSPSGDIKNITVQWSLIAESLNKSVHLKGAHGYGSLLRATGGVSLHHNVWAYHRGRNPRFGDNYGKNTEPAVFDFRNNIVSSWGDYASGTNDGNIHVNYVDNLVRPGKFSSKSEPIVMTSAGDENAQIYIKGNVVPGNAGWTSDNSKMVAWGAPPKELSQEPGKFKLAAAPFDAPKITTWAASELMVRVLDKVGDNYPWRDSVDERIVTQIAENSGKLIDSQEEVGSWPSLPSGAAPLDSDGDGIPDAWEKAHGLNPKDAADGARFARDKSGYTNLEIYLNSLVAPVVAEEAKAGKKR